MKAHTLLLSSAVVLGVLVGASTAFAQNDDGVLEEITVTATRIETDLMSTSIAVSAFTQEDLTRNGVKDIRDASDLVPNFDVSFSPSDSGVQMTMRGINSNNFTEIGDPSVAFHVDGVYSPRPQGAVALMFDLERLEVMRGPQGTLFGRNSAAGSVNVITAKPTTEGIFGTIGAELGNYNQMNVLGTLNLPITDTLAIRGNFFVEQRDGFTDQDTGTKDLAGIGNQGPDGIPDMDQRRNRSVGKDEYYGNADRWAARLSAMWTPLDTLDWRVSVETAQDNGAGWPIAPDCERNPDLCHYNGGGIDYIDPNIPGFLDMKMDAVRSHVNYALTENIDIVYNLGWARQQREQRWDGDMGWRPVPAATTGWLNRNQPWDSLYLATAESHYESWSNELQFQGLTGRVNWILGFFDFREDNDIIFDVEIPFCCSTGALGGISFVQPYRLLDSQAVFGQATWHITDQWHLTLGYRYTEDTREDIGGRNIGCFGGGGCSFSAGLIPNDGHPQTTGETDELLLPQFTSADLVAGMGAQNRVANYQVFDVNDNKETFDEGNWRVGLDYDLNADTFLYAYAATGSKAGAFGDGVDVCRCGRIEFFSFDPEEVLNYEIGYKGTLWDGRMNLIVTAFFTEFKNKQVSQFRTVGFVEDPPGTPLLPLQEIGTLVTSNAGEAEISGVEIEWDVIPWDSGRLTGGIGLLDAKFLKWPGYAGEAYFCEERAEAGPEFECIPQDDGSGTSSIEGKELPYSTPVSFTVAYEHEFELASGAYLKPYVKFHWEDEMHFTEGNFDAIPALSDKRDAIGTLDATLRYVSANDTWNVEAFVYNATDERFPTYWVDSNQPGAPLFTWNGPRTYGVRASYNFRN
ncbi:MAG: TonB-dependent receptor [Gammaproteobacteria bacterium]